MDGVAKPWWNAVLGYALSALLGWVAASIQFGRKLEARDKALRQQMHEDRVTESARLDTLDREIARVGAEVWGPKGESGLRKDVNNLQTEIAKQTITLTEILASVKMLVETNNKERHP